MDRFVIRIIFLNKRTVKLKFLYIDDRLLSIGTETVYFDSNITNFIIYSNHKTTLSNTSNSLSLPNYDKYHSNEENRTSTFMFKNEKEMKKWLKRLYNTILDCNNNFTPFTKDKSYNLRKKQMVMKGEFWVI